MSRCPNCGHPLDVGSLSIPADVVDRAAEMIRAGKSGTAAAAEFGLRYDKLAYLMRKAGTPILSLRPTPPPAGRHGSNNPERTAEMIRQRSIGFTWNEIATTFELSTHRVRQIVKAQNGRGRA